MPGKKVRQTAVARSGSDTRVMESSLGSRLTGGAPLDFSAARVFPIWCVPARVAAHSLATNIASVTILVAFDIHRPRSAQIVHYAREAAEAGNTSPRFREGIRAGVAVEALCGPGRFLF